MIRIFSFIFSSDTGSSSRTVVSVRYIGIRHLRSKQLFQAFIRFRTINGPEMMSETIFCHEIVIGFLILYDIFHNSVYFRNSPVRKEHRFKICIYITGQHHTVLFLIRPCQFMLLNNSVHIIFASCTTDNPILCFAVHRLGINIELRFFILYQPTFFLEHLKIVHTFMIYRFRMYICACRTIDLRTGYMQQ